MSYWRYVARRAAHFVLVYVLLSYAFSFVIHGYLETWWMRTLHDKIEEAVMIGPKGLAPGETITQEELVQRVEERYQKVLKYYTLDAPYIMRVLAMGSQLMRLDFGESFHFWTMGGYPKDMTKQVTPIVLQSLLLSACLFGGTFIVQFALGCLVGLRNASMRTPSRLTMLLGVSSQGMSIAVISMLAAFVFSFCLKWHPTQPWVFRMPWTFDEPLGSWLVDLVRHYWVPFLTLTLGTFWVSAYTIEKLAWGISTQEYIDAARARGLSERRIRYGHIARSASPAIVTLAVQGLYLSLWGSFIVEKMFSLPGIGSLFLSALEWNDRGVVAAILMFVTLIYLIGLFVLDVTYGLLDPRIRVGATAAALR